MSGCFDKEQLRPGQPLSRLFVFLIAIGKTEQEMGEYLEESKSTATATVIATATTGGFGRRDRDRDRQR